MYSWVLCRVLGHCGSRITWHRHMDRSCSFASSPLMKGSFPSTPCGAGQASCLPGRSPGYQGLQKKQIRAIHTGSFLSAFARLITPGGEAVTPAGSNLVPRESCLPCHVCLSPQVWLLETPSLPLVFGACSSLPDRSSRLVRLQPFPPGSLFWAGSRGSVAQ